MLQIESLHVRIQSVEALRGISLSVPDGALPRRERGQHAGLTGGDWRLRLRPAPAPAPRRLKPCDGGP